MTPTDIRVLLLRRGTTVTSIARVAGVGKSTVSLVISGRRATPAARRAVAQAIGFTYVDLWGVPDPGIDRLPPGRRAGIGNSVAESAPGSRAGAAR